MAARKALANLLCTEHSNGLEELRHLAAESSLACMREVVDTAKATIKDRTSVPSMKLRALQALDVCVQAGRQDLVVYTAKKVLSRLSQLANSHRDQDNEARGSTLFGTWNAQEAEASCRFFLTLLGCLRAWAQQHPTLAGTESPYKKVYLKLFAKVAFPPVTTREDQELLQAQQEVALARKQLETVSSRTLLAPVIASLRSRLGALEKALQQPSKRAMQVLDTVEALRAVLGRLYERYPEEGAASIVPHSLTPIPEPTPLPPPRSKRSVPTPRALPNEDSEALCALIKQQEDLITQQKAQIQDLQMQLRTLKYAHSPEPPRTERGRRSQLPLNRSLETVRASDCRQSWSEGLHCDHVVNFEQAKSCLIQQSGLLYEGSLRIRYEWTAPKSAVLYVTNCTQEVLTNVMLTGLDPEMECRSVTPHLGPGFETAFELFLQGSKALCWLAAMKVTYCGTVGLCSLNWAFPVGSVQTVTCEEMTAEECAGLWADLRPFQTVRKFAALRSDLKTLQALIRVVSFKGSFQVFSGVDWPSLGSSALLLQGRALGKAVAICVSLSNSSGCAVAVRVANVRLREALAASVEAAIAAVP